MTRKSVTIVIVAATLICAMDVPAIGAQRPTPAPTPEERAERRERAMERRERTMERRERAMEQARERAVELAPRAEALARAFTLMEMDPDRAVIGVTIGEGSERGVRVEGVTTDGPAARAGVEAGDYLTRVGDVALRLDAADADDPVMRAAAGRRLTRALDDLTAGDEITLGVASDDAAERTVRVTTVRADSLRPEGATAWSAVRRMDGDRATLGLSLAPTGTSRDSLGAFVASVVPGGPAERAGVFEGQRIAAINGVELRVDAPDVEDRAVAASRAARLERAMRDVKAGDEVTLRVWDGRGYRDVRVRSGKASEVFEGQPLRGFRMLETLPGDAGWRMVAPPAPPGPAIAPRAGRLRVAPRAIPAPGARARVMRLERRRMI
ncbi:MAG TPA: PDZ domain-containing protein [Gemmatimonadales bacterium]